MLISTRPPTSVARAQKAIMIRTALSIFLTLLPTAALAHVGWERPVGLRMAFHILSAASITSWRWWPLVSLPLISGGVLVISRRNSYMAGAETILLIVA